VILTNTRQSLITMTMSTDTFVGFLCPEGLLAKAKVKAAKDCRSLSKYLILLVEKSVANEPTLKKAAPANKPKAAKRL